VDGEPSTTQTQPTPTQRAPSSFTNLAMDRRARATPDAFPPPPPQLSGVPLLPSTFNRPPPPPRDLPPSPSLNQIPIPDNRDTHSQPRTQLWENGGSAQHL